MNKIKQILYAATATALIAMPLSVGAVLVNPGANTADRTNQAGAWAGLSGMTFFDFFSVVMNWLLGIIGVLGVVAFVIAGILYLTAAGNEEQIERAKSVMLYAIIGLVLALLGLVIVNAIMGVTGGGSGRATY